MEAGLKNRAVGSTNLNERSSRSHLVLLVRDKHFDDDPGLQAEKSGEERRRAEKSGEERGRAEKSSSDQDYTNKEKIDGNAATLPYVRMHAFSYAIVIPILLPLNDKAHPQRPGIPGRRQTPAWRVASMHTARIKHLPLPTER